MRPARLALPLALVALVACQPDDDTSATPDPVSPAAPVPTYGAVSLKIPNDYFLIFDEDPARNYTTTFGLVSSPGDLEDCGGTGPEVFDGGGSTRLVATPSGNVHVRDELHQATVVFYEGATPDVCELVSRPVLGRGTGNLHFTTKGRADGSSTVQATFGAILDLVAGGRARMLGVGNIAFDPLGNLIIHEDHFDLKPIGR
jgi:hypothetical protein